MSDKAFSRRNFIRNLAVGLPVGSLLLQGVASAQGDELLAMNDPTAQALGYVHDASTVDPAKFPTYKAGHVCNNCLQIKGDEGAAERPCGLFPNKLVSSTGWCSAWVAKP